MYKYKNKKGEPIEIEYRIEPPIIHDCKDEDIPAHYLYGESYSSLCTTSLLFVNKNYLDNIKNYEEGKIFKNDEINIEKKKKKNH